MGSTVDLAVLATVFGLIFVAELPDKSALASLVLGTKYRTSAVFTGVASAFTVHVLLAIVAGSLLTLLPHQVLRIVVAVLFGAGAIALLVRRDPRTEDGTDIETRPEADDPVEGGAAPQGGGVATLTAPAPARTGFRKAALASFTVVLVAEFGDLTQIMTANLAAQYSSPLAVGLGAALAMWAVGGIAVAGGKQLLRWIPLVWVTRVAGLAMAAMCAWNVIRILTP